jgi:quercetin dioxygenase-like cupin family protein
MTEQPYHHTLIPNLDDLVGETPPGSIVSRTFYKDDDARAILFAFAPGETLSEHTASVPAILHFLSGTAVLTIGSETTQAGPGTWAHMAANVPHSILAQEEVKMLLLMLP